MRTKFLLGVLILGSVHLVHAAPATCSDADKKGIERSIKHYLNHGSDSTLNYNEVTLLSKNCAQRYAKVIIHPKNETTDDAIIYLQQGKDSWQVLSLGTFFEPEFLAKLPKTLR